MAKVSGPLLSMSATGTVAKAITYAAWKGISYCREWFKPANPQTQNQVKVRTRLTKAVAKYQTEPSETKAFWNTLAEGQAYSGFNLYVEYYVLFMKENEEDEPTVTNTKPMSGA